MNRVGVIAGLTLTLGVVFICFMGDMALRPHGSLGYAPDKCAASAVQDDLKVLSEGEGFRRAATMFVLRNEISKSDDEGTFIPAILLQVRFELALIFHNELVVRIFCKSAWVMDGSRPIVSLPKIAELLAPFASSRANAMELASCAVVERGSLPSPMTKADASELETFCKNRISGWRRLYSGY